MVSAAAASGSTPAIVRARIHDRKSPLLDAELKEVVVEWTTAQGPKRETMKWYGEYLWRAAVPAGIVADAPYQVCASDASGNRACAKPAAAK
jgi:hypothetical protein